MRVLIAVAMVLCFPGNLPYIQATQEEGFLGSGGGAASRGGGDKSGSGGEKEEGSGQGIVMYKGAMLDINSFMQRLERSDKTRTATEHKLKDLQEEMGETAPHW